jgi:hypothetical protein
MTNLDSLKRRLARLRAEGPGDPSESEAEPSDDDDTADVPRFDNWFVSETQGPQNHNVRNPTMADIKRLIAQLKKEVPSVANNPILDEIESAYDDEEQGETPTSKTKPPPAPATTMRATRPQLPPLSPPPKSPGCHSCDSGGPYV